MRQDSSSPISIESLIDAVARENGVHDVSELSNLFDVVEETVGELQREEGGTQPCAAADVFRPEALNASLLRLSNDFGLKAR